jgi:hypothetical protein
LRPCPAEASLDFHVGNDNDRPKPVTLKAVCGPGDDTAPVLTVMLHDED